MALYLLLWEKAWGGVGHRMTASAPSLQAVSLVLRCRQVRPPSPSTLQGHEAQRWPGTEAEGRPQADEQ